METINVLLVLRLDLVLDQYKACSCNKWHIKMPQETNCILSLGLSKMTENVIFREFYYKVLHFQCTQFCSIMYKDHPDVYCFFIESVYCIALNYDRSCINSWSHLVGWGIQHHNKNKCRVMNKCQISNKRLVQSLLTIPGSVINDELKNIL